MGINYCQHEQPTERFSCHSGPICRYESSPSKLRPTILITERTKLATHLDLLPAYLGSSIWKTARFEANLHRRQAKWGVSAKGFKIMNKRDVEFKAPMPVLKFLAACWPSKNPYTINNHKRKIIFIHIPKNAGRSVYNAALSENARHIPLKRYFAYDSASCRKYFKFAIVRSPVDRFISAFRGLKGSGQEGGEYGEWVQKNIEIFDSIEEFGEWLENKSNRDNALNWLHFWPQYKWIALDDRSKPFVDKILYFDSLISDWPDFAREHGFEANLPDIGKNTRGDEPQISSRLRELINDMYARDLDTFF